MTLNIDHTTDTISATGGNITLGAATVSAINGGPLAGMRNAIVNGSFDHWQRGTSFTSSDFTADRWFGGRVGTTATFSRQSFTLGQTDVPGEPTYFFRANVSSVAGAGNNCTVSQRIEGVRMFAGQQITISFYAKADANKNIAIDLLQRFGTGGTPSSSIDGIGATKKALTTSWQKITHTVTLPSISGKTLGTDGNDALWFYIWFDAGSNFNSRTDTLGQQSGTFDIAQVQVEAGPVATPFERRPIGVELALCQRYYFLSTSNSANIQRRWAGSAVGNSALGQTFFPVTMRAIPNVSTSAVSYTNCSGLTSAPITTSSVSWYCTVTSAAAVYGATWAETYLDAEL